MRGGPPTDRYTWRYTVNPLYMAENEWISLGLFHPNKCTYFTPFKTWFLGPTRPAANLCVLFVLLLMVQKYCTTWDVERHVYILGSTTNLTLGRISELSTLVLCPPSLQNPYLQILHQNCVNLKPIPSMYGIFTYKFTIQINHSCIGNNLPASGERFTRLLITRFSSKRLCQAFASGRAT